MTRPPKTPEEVLTWLAEHKMDVIDDQIIKEQLASRSRHDKQGE